MIDLKKIRAEVLDELDKEFIDDVKKKIKCKLMERKNAV